MNKEYFTDNLSVEDIAEMTDKMLRFEYNQKTRKKKTTLLKIIPAAAAFLLVIGLANILPVINKNGNGDGINPGTAVVNEKPEETTNIIEIDALAPELDEYETKIAVQKQMNEEISDIQARIYTLSKELQEKDESYRKYVSGEMLWPLDKEYDIVSSIFGNRLSPVTNQTEFHTGVDIPAPHGSDIYAANDGIVLIAENSLVYGNYIVIDHGGGIITLYGHASQLLKEAGDKVAKGEIIARVGSTGMSTGNHLHFEYIEDGKPVENGIVGFAGNRIPEVEWWTYDDYKVWVEEYKIKLQESVGTLFYGWTNDGIYDPFILTQEEADKEIEACEAILEGIKNGTTKMLKSKNGVPLNEIIGTIIINGTTKTYSHKVEHTLPNGEEMIIGFGAISYSELYRIVKNYLDEQVEAGNMMQEEADIKLAEVGEN